MNYKKIIMKICLDINYEKMMKFMNYYLILWIWMIVNKKKLVKFLNKHEV